MSTALLHIGPKYITLMVYFTLSGMELKLETASGWIQVSFSSLCSITVGESPHAVLGQVK